MQPNECIWCGLELLDDTTHDTIFACGTVQHPRSDCWSQSTGCEEIMRSRDRIKRAVERLKSAERYDVDEVDPETWCGDDVAQAVDADYVDEAIRILEGVDNGGTE